MKGKYSTLNHLVFSGLINNVSVANESKKAGMYKNPFPIQGRSHIH